MRNIFLAALLTMTACTNPCTEPQPEVEIELPAETDAVEVVETDVSTADEPAEATPAVIDPVIVDRVTESFEGPPSDETVN